MSELPSYIVPSYHPAYLLRNQTLTKPTIEDFRKAARIHETGPTRIPIAERENGSMADAALFPLLDDVEGFFKGWGRTHTRMSIDFEATMTGIPWCVGFWPCDSEDQVLTTQGICIPFHKQGGENYWSPRDHEATMWLLKEYLEDPTQPKVGQNWVGYDGGYNDHGWEESDHSLAYRAFGIRVRGLVLDTMVAHHAVSPELPHSLAFQSSLCTDLGAYKLEVHATSSVDDEKEDDAQKGIQNVKDVDDRVLRGYCLRDCFAAGLSACELERVMA